MFGCVNYSTRVQLADGTTEKIGKIVNQKMDVEVLSYDPVTDRIVPRKVVNWFNNGPAERFLQFTVEKSGGNGKSQFAATPNHLIRTPGGWTEAGDLIAGDRVLAAEPHRLSDQQFQLVLGSLMGDGNLSPNRRDRNGVRFRLGHGAKQVEYLQWKTALLGNIKHSVRENAKGALFVDFTPLPELAELQRAVYLGDGKKFLSEEYLKALTPLALAIWYMDDGSFTVRSKGLQQRTIGGSGRIEVCVEAMSEGSRVRLRDYLRDTHGLDVRLRQSGAAGKAVLVFSTAATAKFQELVAPHMAPSMEYKLLPRFRGKGAVTSQFVEPTQQLVPARVLDVHVKPHTRSMSRFDIEVEGSHNYFADGVMVHNSPETTTGGKALKFYASVRLDVRRIETLKDGTDAVGNRTRCKVVKNKCLAEGTRIFDPVTGTTHRIEDVVDGRKQIHVVAAAKDGTLHARPVVSWFDQGTQDVIGLRIAGGATVWATPDHKVLTEYGWRQAGELRKGDRVAQPRRFDGFGDSAPISAIPEATQERRRGSQATYLAAEMTGAVLNYLDERGVTAQEAAAIIGAGSGNPRGGMKQVLGASRLRRDRVQALADALDDKFLHDVLAEELRYSVIREVLPARRARTFDLEVEELHNLVAEGVVVHNCSPPFKQAEFDILYGKGISKEGSLIDMGVEQGFIRKSGSWFTYEGEQLGQGKENARTFLLENIDVANEIEKKIKEKLGIGAVVTDDEVLPAPVDF
jgi:RecA/RadA recombinase